MDWSVSLRRGEEEHVREQIARVYSGQWTRGSSVHEGEVGLYEGLVGLSARAKSTGRRVSTHRARPGVRPSSVQLGLVGESARHKDAAHASARTASGPGFESGRGPHSSGSWASLRPRGSTVSGAGALQGGTIARAAHSLARSESSLDSWGCLRTQNARGGASARIARGPGFDPRPYSSGSLASLPPREHARVSRLQGGGLEGCGNRDGGAQDGEVGL